MLAKSVLKGVPAQWEPQQRKAWPDVNLAIVRLIDNLEPANRPRAIAFIAAFPDFWMRLQDPTRTALQETVDNAEPAALADYRILAGVTVPNFRDALLATIAALSREHLAEAIAAEPLTELWPRAVEMYRDSGSWRGSEANFRDLIAPFAGRLSSQQYDQLLDAIVENGQNWDAAETDTLLLAMLRNSTATERPTLDARNRFYQQVHRKRRTDKYEDVLTFLQADGWVPPPPEPEPDD